MRRDGFFKIGIPTMIAKGLAFGLASFLWSESPAREHDFLLARKFALTTPKAAAVIIFKAQICTLKFPRSSVGTGNVQARTWPPPSAVPLIRRSLLLFLFCILKRGDP